MTRPKVLLFNPRSARSKPRIPNSILSIAASIEGRYEYVIVDGNCEADPAARIFDYLERGGFGFFACTVMPGPQLQQAIPITRDIRAHYPGIHTVWGGYFPSNQPQAVLGSGYVDFVVSGPGDKCFPALLDALTNGSSWEQVPNLIYGKEGGIVRTRKDELYDQDALPDLPYEKLDGYYPLGRYLGKTCLGSKTIAYHSSIGCPFKCAFCAVVPIYNARWSGKSAERIYADIKLLRGRWGGNAIEFHDNNFFVSEKRTAAFARLIAPEGISWWGEGRIDTIHRYSDETLALMRDSGCKMIFFGAETGNDEVLKRMDKGGTQTGAQIKEFAARMARFDIIPEYSFVLGTPGPTPEAVMKQIDEDIAFIRAIKEINPRTEIVIYVYSPVAVEGTQLYREAQAQGFRFPEKLEDWIAPAWASFDLRKNPLTPWLTPEMIDRIKDFETVLNGYYPTVSDVRMSPLKRRVMRSVAALRYRSGLYKMPYELKVLQRLWKYRRPEIEGF
ncbi:B12-binding domain-containing radical SAM protein [Flaviaesturariibacter aridisoli]|uniref:B12-binding domain-containing radical SAM protein n=1 Tax=Flaviaesturariibacter aridisoli TaxID=2545761 RepID=A0A4R4E3L6_9BACT|nr:radical SAM protein [Flaviaesturariibacter aridisoli]TCZ70610.1 B12-binding domain-containing radical SAM protein [Flaviaesturariibacter aridisoli]